jgi:hypothetical protein
MNKHLQTLMQKEMTRKEFLTALGLGVVSVLGFSSLLKFLTGKDANQQFAQTSNMGYGARTYGR